MIIMESEMGEETRRIVKVQCSFELLSAIFSGEIGVNPGFRVKTDAPSDLKIVAIEPWENVKYGWVYSETAWLYCTSAMFEPVGEGAEPPTIDPFTFRLVSLDIMSLIEAYRVPVRTSVPPFGFTYAAPTWEGIRRGIRRRLKKDLRPNSMVRWMVKNILARICYLPVENPDWWGVSKF